jgi:hypothetical protein
LSMSKRGNAAIVCRLTRKWLWYYSYGITNNNYWIWVTTSYNWIGTNCSRYALHQFAFHFQFD